MRDEDWAMGELRSGFQGIKGSFKGYVRILSKLMLELESLRAHGHLENHHFREMTVFDCRFAHDT